MPGRLKRSQKRARALEPAVRPMPSVTERMLSAICPVCGRTIPENRAIKIGHVTVDRVSYFGSIDWDPNKAFGVSFPAGGKGSLRGWEHIGPEDASELFEQVKSRFLQALKEWVDKGWLSAEEIEEALRS